MCCWWFCLYTTKRCRSLKKDSFTSGFSSKEIRFGVVAVEKVQRSNLATINNKRNNSYIHPWQQLWPTSRLARSYLHRVYIPVCYVGVSLCIIQFSCKHMLFAIIICFFKFYFEIVRSEQFCRRTISVFTMDLYKNWDVFASRQYLFGSFKYFIFCSFYINFNPISLTYCFWKTSITDVSNMFPVLRTIRGCIFLYS